MKRLKQILIGIIFSALLIPMITNNVHAAYEDIYSGFSFSGYGSGSDSKSTNTISFNKYSALKISGQEYCSASSSLGPSHSVIVYAVDAETGKEERIGSGSWGISKSGDTYIKLNYTINLSMPSFNKGYIKMNYSWSNVRHNTGSHGGCSLSGTITGTLIPHTHSYTPSVTTEATCTTDGETTWTCSCGDSYTTPIPATGHTFQTLTINGQKAAERCIKCGFLGSGNLMSVEYIHHLPTYSGCIDKL